jgi:hypothetical protein
MFLIGALRMATSGVADSGGQRCGSILPLVREIFQFVRDAGSFDLILVRWGCWTPFSIIRWQLGCSLALCDWSFYTERCDPFFFPPYLARVTPLPLALTFQPSYVFVAIYHHRGLRSPALLGMLMHFLFFRACGLISRSIGPSSRRKSIGLHTSLLFARCSGSRLDIAATLKFLFWWAHFKGTSMLLSYLGLFFAQWILGFYLHLSINSQGMNNCCWGQSCWLLGIRMRLWLEVRYHWNTTVLMSPAMDVLSIHMKQDPRLWCRMRFLFELGTPCTCRDLFECRMA